MNEPGRQNARRAEFLAEAEACMAVILALSTPGFTKENTFDNCWFSAEGVLLSAFAVPHHVSGEMNTSKFAAAWQSWLKKIAFYKKTNQKKKKNTLFCFCFFGVSPTGRRDQNKNSKSKSLFQNATLILFLFMNPALVCND